MAKLMRLDVFQTQREFNKNYPSKIYICSFCNSILTDPKTCNRCGWRADGLFKTMGKGYTYIIKEISEEVQEIFKPIELEKGKDNGNEQR